MINLIKFTAKNLTSNAGVLLLLDYSNDEGMFQEIDEILVLDNKSTEEIKMNHLKTIIYGGFVGVDKLERFRLLEGDPLIKVGNNYYNVLMAFCDELKAYVTGFMRSGNTYTSNGAAEMIKEIIEKS